MKVPPGVNWDPYKIKTEQGDKVVLENLKIVRPMKGGSIASACNTNFESRASSAGAMASACNTVFKSQAQSAETKPTKRKH